MPAMRYIERLRIWIAGNAVVCGDVQLGESCSVWHHAVMRGDVAPIRLGKRVNVQDHAMLHCHAGIPLEIGDDVTIGHHATVHCRRVGRGSLIGINSVVLDEAEIGEDCIVAAGAVVTPRTVVASGSVVMGAPAKVMRQTTSQDREYIRLTIAAYIDLARQHAANAFPDIE